MQSVKLPSGVIKPSLLQRLSDVYEAIIMFEMRNGFEFDPTEVRPLLDGTHPVYSVDFDDASGLISITPRSVLSTT